MPSICREHTKEEALLKQGGPKLVLKKIMLQTKDRGKRSLDGNSDEDKDEL
jgi:hypothetical protein